MGFYISNPGDSFCTLRYIACRKFSNVVLVCGATMDGANIDNVPSLLDVLDGYIGVPPAVEFILAVAICQAKQLRLTIGGHRVLVVHLLLLGREEGSG